MGQQFDFLATQNLHQLAQYLADAITVTNSDSYFDQLTQNITQTTGSDFAFISRIANDQEFAETVSVFGHGSHLENFSYTLDGTPCLQAVVGEQCLYPASLDSLFTDISYLDDMGAKAYAGIRLTDHNAACIGLLAIAFTRPIDNHDSVLSLLKLFAVPAAMQLSLLREKHARNLLESRLNSILAIANEAIIATDENSNIILFNAGAETIFGYQSEELIGQSVNRLLPQQLREQHSLQMKGFMDSNETYRLMRQRTGDIVARRKDGQDFPAEASITKSRSDEGTVVMVVLRDVSERQQSERAIQSATRMQTLGNLAAGLAHDFNNILTLIRGSLDLLAQKSCAESEKQHYLGVAARATDRGAELVSRLLAFGRPRTLEPEAVNPAELIDQLIDMLQVTLGEHIDVRFEKGTGNCLVFADPSQLENAIVNLSFNARDAMQAGGKLVIRIDCVNFNSHDLPADLELSAGHYACITVGDTGAGMTEEIKESALEAFYSTKMDSGGTGLGLSMVLGFVRSAHGAVRIRSQIGVGTEIEIYLPVYEEQKKPVAFDLDYSQGKETILIVEDQPDVRELAVHYARTLGYEVVEAENGPQALQIMREHSDIDLLFTDYQLPGGLSGLEVAEEFQRMHPRARTLISSGYDTQHIDLAKYPLLPKPYSLATFAKYLRNMLDE